MWAARTSSASSSKTSKSPRGTRSRPDRRTASLRCSSEWRRWRERRAARIGAARGADDVLCVVWGTGIGGGLVIHGVLHLGVEDRAGEIGHHTVVEDGPLCGCGNRGCLELLAGARAIAEAARQPSFDGVVTAARAVGAALAGAEA